MKRVGLVMSLIADPENLREAFLRAAKGKSRKCEVVKFRLRLDEHLYDLRQQLLAGDYTFGKYHYFQVFDPKLRTICAASFDERVVQHAMMRILHPVFDNYQIYDSYACRLGKGTYKAIARAPKFVKPYHWFVKMDVRKFFDNIDHQVLKNQLGHLFTDRSLLQLLFQLVDSYEVQPDKGLPIGNLSSQYFANHYLSGADHYAKEVLRIKALVRYMDDIVLFGNQPKELLQQAKALTDYIRENLLLEIHPVVMNQTRFGLPFLGYVVSPQRLRLSSRSRHRFRKRTAILEECCNQGIISQEEFRTRYTTMCAFIEKAQTRPFLQAISKERHLH